MPNFPGFRPVLRRTAVLLLAAAAVPPAARAEANGPTAALPTDPLLRSLIAEALEVRPEVAQARALVEADRRRVPQAGAPADPSLSVGIQNDGFRDIQVGEMETSYYQLMVTQPFFWPGKRGLRTDVARLQVGIDEANLRRTRLTVEADVRRAYLDLLLVRGRLQLLGELESLWAQSERIARARYEVGQSPQSDLLRAQLERNRLKQQRWALQADERARVQALNRLRSFPLDEPIPTSISMEELGAPALPELEQALAVAEQESPELARALVSVDQARRRVALAARERYPDLSVSAGIMPRGDLEPMWLLSIGSTLPIFAGRKQAQAVDESERRVEVEAQGAEAVRQVLRLRMQERLTVLESLLLTNRFYRDGLLVQSRATSESTIRQYEVGRVTFASVLEALGGYVSDRVNYLDSIAQAHRIAVAQAELSLEPTPALGGAMGAGSVPGAGATGGGMSTSGGGSPAAATAGSPSGAASGMSKM